MIHRSRCAREVTSPGHRCDAQHSRHTRNKGSEDRNGSSQNKGTTFNSELNRSVCTPVNLLGEHKLQLQQAEAKLQSLECSNQQKLQLVGSWHHPWSRCYELQRPLNYKTGTRFEPFAVLAELGWVVSKPMTDKRRQNVYHFAFTEDVKVTENMQTCWDIETYASKINVVGQSKKELQEQRMLESSTKFTGERYEVGMLSSEPEPNLPNN